MMRIVKTASQHKIWTQFQMVDVAESSRMTGHGIRSGVSSKDGKSIYRFIQYIDLSSANTRFIIKTT